MSCLIVINNSFYKQPESIEKLTYYITDPTKARVDLIAAQGLVFCDEKCVIQQFEDTMRIYGNYNRFMHHFVISFDTQGAEGYVIPNKALEIVYNAFRFCFSGQMLFACHTNTEHIHVHVICSHVGMYGGHFPDGQDMYYNIAGAIQFYQENYRRDLGAIYEKTVGQENEELDELYTDKPCCFVQYRKYNETKESLIENDLESEALI